VERVVLDGAVGNLEVLRFAAHRGATDLGERLCGRGQVAVAVALVLELEEAPELRAESPPPLPAGNAAELWAAVLALLGELRPGAPVSAIRLEVEVRSAAGRQADLWRGGDAEREAVLHMATRLQRRYGETTLRRPRLAVDPGDLPERRFRWEAPVPAAMAPAAPLEASAPPETIAVPPARPSTQPAQTGKVPWSRAAPSRPGGRGHPRPVPSAQTALQLEAGRVHV
jgi:hypothetical protein